MDIIIVGGVAGGASTATRLRRLDEQANITIFEKDGYVSFANCGLPYYIGGTITDKSQLTLQTPESFKERFNVDVFVKHKVTAVDRARKVVTVHNIDADETFEQSYDKLVLAPGAYPVMPPIPNTGGDRVFTLRNIEDTYRIKGFIDSTGVRSAVVVGGGFIGVEMAENLHDAGLQVSIVELSNQLFPPFDPEMAAECEQHIEQRGVKLYLKNGVTSIDGVPEGLAVTLSDGTSIEVDMLIMSVGVRPQSELARDCGLPLNGAGAIIVDEHMRTQDPNIYAVGDAVEIANIVTMERGLTPLAGPANKQGRIAADNICGIPSVYTGAQGSAIVKCFDFVAACTGISEKTAQRLGYDYEKSYTYSASHAGYYPGGEMMSVKLIFDNAAGLLLGAQVVGGEGVDKRCDVLATAIRNCLSTDELIDLELSYAPPFSSARDPVNIAGMAAENIRAGLVDVWHWHDAPTLDRERVTLVDVRTTEEFAHGHFDGAINIPVDGLRDRLHELDRDKPVYVNCRSGQRSYIACRILTQHGFNAFNLSGGYRLYEVAQRKLEGLA